MFGYTGKILHVDVTSHTSWVEEKDAEFYKKYVGGIGLAVRLLYENTPAKIDPLSPQNALCFGTSSFSGTTVPVGTKHGVAFKSPLTGFVGDCLSGSHFSEMIRRAGWDGFVITGASPDWSVLFIDDDDVQFLDASKFMGLGTIATQKAIREWIGDENVRVSSIGPAGENLVRYALVDNDGRQAGRTGPGAVMGSKKIKAIAIRGSHPITIANMAGLLTETRKIVQISQGPGTAKYRILGTPSNVLNMNKMGVLPTRNFQQTEFEHAETVSGEYLHEHFTRKTVGCSGCTIGCEQWAEVREGPYKGSIAGLDYEPLFALGPACGIGELPPIIYLSQLCDELGMDSMSAGIVVAWTMECYEKGLLTKEDCDGLEPTFGNAEASIELIKKIAKREGIGNMLAEGTKRASAQLGKGSDHFAMQVKGLEMPGYDVRSMKTFAVGLATGTRGADHNRSLAYEVDVKGTADRFTADATRGKLAMDKENFACILDCLAICKFARNCFEHFSDDMANIYTMVTGIPMTPGEVDAVGERVCNLKKAFNIREGWTRADDTLPPRAMQDPIPSGPGKGCFVSQAELDMMIDSYYKARGWTRDGLIPRSKLISLGMEDIASEIGVDETEQTPAEKVEVR
ncbi:MAG: aldehyde ferredoxin oxidoreductase family protein [Anaerolineae bacterium]